MYIYAVLRHWLKKQDSALTCNPNISAAALGRALDVGSMMGSMLKSEKEQLTIRINGHGPIGTIFLSTHIMMDTFVALLVILISCCNITIPEN